MVLPLLSFLIGAGAGSFVNVMAARVMAQKSIILPRSFCDACAKPLWRRDLIPMVSFFLLRARCRFCHARIAWQYPIVEFVTAALFLVAAFKLGVLDWRLIHAWISIVALVALFLTDLRAMILPDRITLPAIVILLVVNLAAFRVDATELLIAALVGGGFFGLQYTLSRGQWVGDGDMRIGILMAMILQRWQPVVVALAVSYIIGAGVCLVLIALHKRKLKDEIPLGVFLVVGTLIVYFFGQFFLNSIV